MDFGPLLDVVREVQFEVQPQSVDATVTRPFPDDTPIATRAIWVAPMTESVPFGIEFQRREARRVLALRRDQVETVPRGTLIEAPERPGGEDQRWRVESTDHVATDHIRVLVVPDPDHA